MPNQLDLPDDLKHLIEKRDDGDRRDRVEPDVADEGAERRRGGRREADQEQGAADAPENPGGHQVQ
jgi:hypothetical protein